MSSEFIERFTRNEERNDSLTENAADPSVTNSTQNRAELMLGAIRNMLMRRHNDG